MTGWLGREGIYSLKNEHSDAEDPTASFLFGDRTGYCVHFAHAATYLMRSLGVPARVATGYAVSESARQGGSSLLLSGAASHAWPEVFIDDFGWVVLDVYPERALDPPEQPMDADLQRLLGELARGASPIPLSATDLPKIKELARRITLTVRDLGLGAVRLRAAPALRGEALAPNGARLGSGCFAAQGDLPSRARPHRRARGSKRSRRVARGLRATCARSIPCVRAVDECAPCRGIRPAPARSRQPARSGGEGAPRHSQRIPALEAVFGAPHALVLVTVKMMPSFSTGARS